MLHRELVCQTLGTRPAVYDSTILEPFFHYGTLHHKIVAMGVDANGAILLQSELHGTMQNALHLTATGYTMNGGIGRIIEPLTIVDDIISRVNTATKYKSGNNTVTANNDIAVAARNVAAK